MGSALNNYSWLIVPAAPGFLFFLFFIPMVHPPAHIPEISDSGLVTSESQRFIENAGYEPAQLKPHAVLRSNDGLLNQQIAHLGKSRLIEYIKNGFLHFIPSYYWQVVWIDTGDHENVNIAMDSYKQPAGIPVFRTTHSPDGAIQQFILEDRRGTNMVRPATDPTATGQTQADHSQARQLQPGQSQSSERQSGQLQPWQFQTGQLQSEIPGHDIIKHQLRRSVWDNHLMRVDTVYSGEFLDQRVVRVILTPQTDIFEHIPVISLSFTPEGMLQAITHEVTINGYEAPDAEPYAGLIRVLFFIFIILLLLILFFRRIIHRLLDVQGAGFYGLTGGILCLLHLTLLLFQASAFTHIDPQFLQIIALIFAIILVSAVFGLLVFMVSGLGESLAREAWPEKITSLALIRLGYLDSRQVGNSLSAGVLAAFIYLGLASVLYSLSGHSYQNPLENHLFLSQSYLLPPWHLMIQNLLLMFMIAGGIFACFLSWAAINKRNTLLLLILGGASFSLISSYSLVTPDSSLILLIWFIPGLFAAWIYLKYDLLALMLSVFLFLALWQTMDGRVIPDSPDVLLAWSVYILPILFLAAGLYLSEYGKEYGHIPELTPEYILEIAREQRVERELEIARQVHNSFLPSNLPTLEGLEISAKCHAAFDVGGDYYDVIPVDDHRMAFVIGDVSGKGIQAAFYMTMVKGIFQSLVKEIPDPLPLLTRINRLFYENARRGSFISVCYGLIDTRTGQLKYARAGHNPAIWIRAGDPNADMLRSGGMALGLTHGTEFEESLSEVSITMKPGDSLIFYTDGITEALNPRNQMFGDSRLLDEAKKHSTLPARNLLDQLASSVNRFTASTPVSDDMTMVIIRFVKANAP